MCPDLPLTFGKIFKTDKSTTRRKPDPVLLGWRSLMSACSRLHAAEGWRLGVCVGFWSSTVVLCINVVLVGVASRHGGYVDGIGILAEGTSQYTSNLSTGYHILINVMSTILPSSSNYCMQVLSAPTRADMDKAHEQGIYLDIQT